MDIFFEGRKGNPAALWIRSRTNSRTKTSCQTEACGTRREHVRLERERGRGWIARGPGERGRNEKERKRRRDGLIEAGMMFNSKKLKTRPANYAASHAINLEEDWTRRGKRKKRRKRSEKKRREN